MCLVTYTAQIVHMTDMPEQLVGRGSAPPSLRHALVGRSKQATEDVDVSLSWEPTRVRLLQALSMLLGTFTPPNAGHSKVNGGGGWCWARTSRKASCRRSDASHWATPRGE